MGDREMFKVDLEGEVVEVARDTTVMEAAEMAGVGIPALCGSPLTEPYGACRLCMVEVDDGGGRRLVASCTFPVRSDLKVDTSSERVVSHRRNVLELLYARWPKVEAIREMARSHGIQRPRPAVRGADCNPRACILCGLCVQACRRLNGQEVISFAGSGSERRLSIPRPDDGYCTGCGICVEVCPTEALSLHDHPGAPGDADAIRRAGMEITRDIVFSRGVQGGLRRSGTARLIESMSEANLLPVANCRAYGHEDAKCLYEESLSPYFDTGSTDACWLGCGLSCRKSVSGFEPQTGPYAGEPVSVEGPDYGVVAGASNMGIFDPDFVMEYCFYCGTYGIDPISFATSTAFVMECFEQGILDAEKTDGLKLEFGNDGAALALLHAVAESRGFGRIAGKGIRFMKYYFEEHYDADGELLEDIGMESKGLELPQVATGESLVHQAALGAGAGGDLQDGRWPMLTGVGKDGPRGPEELAEALHSSQLWNSWFSLCGLCGLPWNSLDPEKAPARVLSYCGLFEGVTGSGQTPGSLLEMSERVHNFRRVFDLRMGYGTREHDSLPYRAQGPVTEDEYETRRDMYDSQLREEAGTDPESMSAEEKVSALRKHREDRYNRLLDALYRLRGWSEDGVPGREKLEELGVDFPEVLEVITGGR